MNNTWQKGITALKIEYHWWQIRRLRRQLARSQKAAASIDLHRFRAAQLSRLYEVLSGIRDTAGRVIG